MKIQILVAAMNQVDYSLIDKMNIVTDVIVSNQCDRNSIEKFESDGRKVSYLNFAEKGVGLNRNNALMRADADVCLFADDDMVYCSDYVDKVINAFKNNSHADVIIFNLKEKEPTRFIIKKKTRVGRLNYLRYGTARIAVRLDSIKKNAIYFNQCFGGGTKYSHGEDNLFLTACLNNNLKIIAVPEFIAELTEERESTWLKSYDEKFIRDQGVLYKTISRRWWKLLCFQDAFRHRKLYKISTIKAYRMMTRQGDKR